MKALLLCVSSQDVYNFRLPLINCLKMRGYEVCVCAFDDKYLKELMDCGIELYTIPNNNRSTNPYSFFILYSLYKKLIRRLKPDFVFSFMMKPNTIGILASHRVGIKTLFSMVEGAGEAFSNKTFRMYVFKYLECILYKASFKHISKVVFLNNDDLNEFVSLRLLPKEKAFRINGIGVDLSKFTSLLPQDNDEIAFVMVSRLIKTKGVFDYCECSRNVKKKYPSVVFYYLGGEGDLSINDIKTYIDDGSIEYCGNVKDVRPYLAKSRALILPSFYREGLPMSIMEAQASSRCVITTNNIGCKETVIDGYNGFLVNKNCVNELVDKCVFLIEHKDKAVLMGQNARRFAETNFNQELINKSLIEELNL